jgi:membrane protease YdiL (CAAX protease family)
MPEQPDAPLEPAIEPTTQEPVGAVVRRIFVGDDGLRAGWSLLLFFILIFAASMLTNFIIFHFHLLPKPPKDPSAQPITAKGTLRSDGLTFGLTAFVAWLMSLIERRPWTRYGIKAQRAIPDFFSGLGWGFFCLSSLIGLLLLTHSIVFTGSALHGAGALGSGAVWLAGFLCVGLAEEFLTRGYIQYTVARGISGITRALDPRNRYSHAWGFWVAAFLFSACLFMAAHLANRGETPWGILQVGLAGTVFAYSLWRTGSLWWAIGFHTSWDWAQSYFYGTNDSGLAAAGHLLNSHPAGNAMLSGGSTGPEGSILCTPIFLLIAAIIYYTLPRREYPLTPDQSPLPLTTDGASETHLVDMAESPRITTPTI